MYVSSDMQLFFKNKYIIFFINSKYFLMITDGRSQHSNLKGGGALQVSLDKLIIDYYPYHRACECLSLFSEFLFLKLYLIQILIL